MTTITITPPATGSTPPRSTGRSTRSRADPSLARFEFRVRNRWIDGTHSRSTIQGFWGAGQEDASRERPFDVDASEPPVLLGHNEAPNPAELPAARARRLPDADDRQRRRGAQGRAERGQLDARGRARRARRARARRRRTATASSASTSRSRSRASAPPEKLREIVERAQARSVVYDMVTNGVPVDVQRGRGLSRDHGAHRAHACRRRPRRDSPSGSPRTSAPRPPATTATAATRTRASSRCVTAGYFVAAVPAELGGRGRGLRPRPRRRLGPPGPGRRVGRHRREHAHGRDAELARRWRMARGAPATAAASDAFARVAAGDRPRTGSSSRPRMSEPGQDLTRPATRAVRTGDGWRIDGHKIFCTMSPAATDAADRRCASPTTRGVGALRLRARSRPARPASRSTTTGTRSACAPPAATPSPSTASSCRRPRCAAASPSATRRAYLDRNLASGLFHASASLGIAEAAFARVARPERIGDDARGPDARRGVGDRPRRGARGDRARGVADRRPLRGAPGRRRAARTRSSPCSRRRRRRRRSSATPPRASSTARSRSPAAPATSTARRSRAPTATSAPAASCTRSAPTARTGSSATSPSAGASRCASARTSRHRGGRHARGAAARDVGLPDRRGARDRAGRARARTSTRSSPRRSTRRSSPSPPRATR